MPTPPVEPVYNPATDTLVYQDDFSRYATTADLFPPCMALSAPQFVDRGWEQCAIGGLPNPAQVFLIPGRRTGAKGVRLAYSGTYQESLNVTCTAIPDTLQRTAVITNWFRLSGIGAIKFIELFHLLGGRLQVNTHDHLPCPVGFPFVWQIYDTAATACQANQPVGPTPTDVTDNLWHRFTILTKPNSAVGARDGRVAVFIDGTLIIWIELAAVGVTPPGGLKTWCSLDDLDGLSTAGFVEANYGGPLTTTPPPFNYDITDFQLFLPGTAGGAGGGGVLTSLVLTPASAQTAPGSSATYTVAAFDDLGASMTLPSLTLHISDPAIGTPSLAGSTLSVLGLADGTASVSVSSGTVQSNTVAVTVVTPPSTLASLALGPDSVAGQAGQNVSVGIVALDQNKNPMGLPTLTYQATNTSVARITGQSGSSLSVTCFEAGLCSVWVTSGSIVSNKVLILVTDPSGGKGHLGRGR